jgi:hypothetical protein
MAMRSGPEARLAARFAATMLVSTGMTPPKRAIPLISTAAFSRMAAAHSPLRSVALKGCGVVLLPMLLSACSWSWFGLNSSAGTTHAKTHGSGSLSVAPARDFAYLPAREGHVSPNRIENTGMTALVLKDDISLIVRNDVANSLRLAGFRIDDNRRVLSGSIEAFSVDDTRSPALWTLKMHYVVIDSATQKVMFTTTRTVKQKSPKFTSNTIAIDDTVKLSVDALIDDPGFIKAVN